VSERRLHTAARAELERLIRLLCEDGYRVIGPTLRDGVIVYDEIRAAGDLPVGWTDRQEPGRYRTQKRDDDACFGFVVGPHSWKQFLFPSRIRIFAADRNQTGGFEVDLRRETPPRYAFLGVRACELAAIAIQDRIIGSEIPDAYYHRTRRDLFTVAVNCLEPAATCFCASMRTGPRCTEHFDLCLTELNGYLGVEVGSEAGAELLQRLEHRDSTPTEQRLFQLLVDRASEHMGRRIDTEGLPELLARRADSPRWKEIGERCLACGNCTMVCPTCFCYNVYDHTDLTGDHAERRRRWGSCFALEFTYMAGQNVRTSRSSRYRQWMTHKLSSWHQQFGSSGCVGCGRCITWCPVGIDLTEEAAAFAHAPAGGEAAPAAAR